MRLLKHLCGFVLLFFDAGSFGDFIDGKLNVARKLSVFVNVLGDGFGLGQTQPRKGRLTGVAASG